MIVQFIESGTGIPVYVNPTYVETLRPDPADPHRVTVIKLGDGEVLRVQDEHANVADKLATPQ
jgi:uncharacterized protein YlzI (FlbEa/FlbD family)